MMLQIQYESINMLQIPNIGTKKLDIHKSGFIQLNRIQNQNSPGITSSSNYHDKQELYYKFKNKMKRK